MWSSTYLLGTGVRILQTRALPAWLGWSAAVLAVAVLVVAGLPFLKFGMAVEPLVLLWILAVAIVLVTRSRSEVSPADR